MKLRLLALVSASMILLTSCAIASQQTLSDKITRLLSIDDILRIPLTNGEFGRRYIVTELFRASGSSLSPGEVFGGNILKSPITLPDGNRISEILDYTEHKGILIGLDETSCFTKSKALEITKAEKADAIHGYQLYDDYYAVDKGIFVSFTVVAPRLDCISSINIGALPQKEEQKVDQSKHLDGKSLEEARRSKP